MTASAAEKEYRRKQTEFSRISADEWERRNAIFQGEKSSGGACPCHPTKLRFYVKTQRFHITDTMESSGNTTSYLPTENRCEICESRLPLYGSCISCHVSGSGGRLATHRPKAET